MTKILPTGPFLYVHFVPRRDSKIIRPDGASNPDADIVVQAMGPEVPETNGISIGDKLLLRGDAKIFPFPPMEGMPCLTENSPTKAGPACIDYRSVMAVVEDEPAEVVPLTDEQIEAIRLG